METTCLSSGRARVKSSQSFATGQPCYPLSLTPSRLTSPPLNHFHSSDCPPGLLLRFSFPKFLQWLQHSEFQVSMWMCDLFHFPDGLAHCHDDIREGLVRVVRLVLNVNYPNLISDGFIALAASPPVRTCCCIVDGSINKPRIRQVVYITSATYSEVAQYVCSQLNLPSSTIRLPFPIICI